VGRAGEGCLGVPEALGGGETWRELQEDFYSWYGQNVGFPAVHLMTHVIVYNKRTFQYLLF